MKSLKLLTAFAAVALVAACSGPWDIETLRGTTRTTAGTPFTQGLTEEYRSFTLYEADHEKDWENAYIFAAKGLHAAQGENVLPENPGNWPIAQPWMQQLTEGRGRLMAALDGPNGRSGKPQIAAKAQVRYDCWVEQSEEGWQDAEIAACRGEFYYLLGLMEQRVVAPPPPPPAPMAQREFIIYFDWDSARLTPEGLRIIEQAASEARSASGARIVIVGHADRSGPESYNLRLSLRRADAVRAALAQRGVATERTSVTALGESEPAVPTADGVREPRNRRVVVTIR